MTQRLVVPELVNALQIDLRNHLQEKLIRNVPVQFRPMLTYVDVDSKARLMVPWEVKIGRIYDPLDYDEEPETPAIIVGINVNDPSDLGNGWKHEVASQVESSSTNLGIDLVSVYEVGSGGTTMWWRKFTVFYDCYYMDSDQLQDEASRLTNAMRGIVERCCAVKTRANPHGWEPCLEDALGERSLRPEVAKSHYWEGGGPDTPVTGDFIWRGITWLQVLTARIL